MKRQTNDMLFDYPRSFQIRLPPEIMPAQSGGHWHCSHCHCTGQLWKKYSDKSEGNFFTEGADFRSVTETPTYVDKTLLLGRLFSGLDRKLIVAPSGCGKSTSLDMVRSFASVPVDKSGNRMDPNATEAHRLFKTLKVYKETEFFYRHFAMYPVVYYDLTCSGTLERGEDIYTVLRSKLHASFRQHAYLQESVKLIDEGDKMWCQIWCDDESFTSMTDEAAVSGLADLIQYLYLHFNKTGVLVLVDNFSGIISDAKSNLNAKDLKVVETVMERHLSPLFKPNRQVVRAIAAGTSAGSNGSLWQVGVDVFDVLADDRRRHLSDFYGFTQSEVVHVFSNPLFRLDNGTIEEALKRLTVDSYTCSTGKRMYSQSSVLSYLKNITVKNT